MLLFAIVPRGRHPMQYVVQAIARSFKAADRNLYWSSALGDVDATYREHRSRGPHTELARHIPSRDLAPHGLLGAHEGDSEPVLDHREQRRLLQILLRQLARHIGRDPESE